MKTKKAFSIIGIILGLYIIGFAIYMRNAYISLANFIPDKAEFGADFYTYQYKATKDVSSNLHYISMEIREIYDFGCVTLTLLGGLVIRYFGCKLGECNNQITTTEPTEKNTQETTLDVEELE